MEFTSGRTEDPLPLAGPRIPGEVEVDGGRDIDKSGKDSDFDFEVDGFEGLEVEVGADTTGPAIEA